MRTAARLIFSSLLLLACSQSGFAAGISLLGGVNLATPTNNDNVTTFKASPAISGGLLLDFALKQRSPSVAYVLEVGALYLSRSFQEIGDATVPVSARYLKYPVLLRLSLGRALSIGAGGYYAKASGELSVDGTSTTFEAVGLKQTDFGVMGALQIRIPLKKSLSALLDGRYALGLTNTATEGDFRHKDIQAFFGIRLGN